MHQFATISVGRRGLSVQFVVQNQDFQKITDVLPTFLERTRERDEFAFVNVNLEFTSPELEVDIDRNRAESLGVRVADIAETIRVALDGQSRDFAETGQSLGFVFALALVLVYLVLAAQFESFRDPFTIMLTVPLALAGGLLALWYTDQTLNIFSQIGLIMLVGLVTKNGILLVEFANQRRRYAGSLREAMEEAAAARFRPILMTTISTILGTLSIALALGSGAQSRIPLGVAVIGGLVVGSLLTLFVVPAA